MKIILPYDSEEYFTRSGLALIEQLGLLEYEPINMVLQNWSAYTLAATTDIYERVVDDVFEAVQTRFGYGPEGVRIQTLLSEHTDELTEVFIQLARKLEFTLATYPDEHTRQSMGRADYHFLRVEKIDYNGKFISIVTDVIDAP